MPSLSLPTDFGALLSRADTTKLVATADADGTPYLSFTDSVYLRPDGYLEYLEFEEFSKTNKNLTRSLWFSKKVALLVRPADGRSFLLRGRVYKGLIAGPDYERHYVESRRRFGDVGLSTLWVIEPEEFLEETPPVRAARDGTGRIPLIHLDRIARQDA